MFIINGEPLNPKTHPQQYAWMQSKFEELRKSGKKMWTYSAFQRRAKIMREDGRLVPQKTRKRIVSLVGSTSDATEGIPETWAYATGFNALKADSVGGYTLNRSTMPLDFDTKFDVTKSNDIELVFFFEYLSKNRNIRKIDYEAQAKNNAEKAALRSKAESLVYSNDSPLHPDSIGSDQPLKTIALSWGVTNAMNLDMYSIMTELWNKVQTNQNNYRTTKRGFKEFIDEVGNYGDSSKRATITLAIEKGTLRYDGGLWKLVTAGGVEQPLCAVPKQDEVQKDEYVMEYLLNTPKWFEVIEASLNKSQGNPIEGVKLGRFDLIKVAKSELGWSHQSLTKKSNKELEEILAEKKEPENA